MIEVKNIKRKFGRRKVLDGISFTANKGEITCLIGLNGAGKTTILNAIMGLTPIQDGQILINGERIHKESYEKISYIPDAITMLPQMKISEAMQFMENERISRLSKGNIAKVNILLGLSLDVDFILMDEPFSGIDLFSREQIADVFTSHLVENRGVIITTHEINDIEHLIDKVVLLNDGTVLKEFRTEDVRENEGKSVVDVMREVYQR
jgi:ABC-2 type transport system ATP-binding protein